jgi:hypothetical protein
LVLVILFPPLTERERKCRDISAFSRFAKVAARAAAGARRRRHFGL